MRTIYLDNEYRCHVSNETGEYTTVTTEFFDNKCDQYIEGYRYVPADCEWVNNNGKTFKGLMITPWKPMSELDEAQLTYEMNILREYSAALTEIEAAISAPDVYGTTSDIVELRKQNILNRINEMLNVLMASSES